MKKVLIVLAVVLFGYLALSSHISSNTKEYLTKIIDSYNKAEGDTINLKLESVAENSAVIKMTDLSTNSSIDLNASLTSGPILSDKSVLGLLRVEIKKGLEEFLTKEEAKALEEIVRKPIEIEYDGLLDFMYVMHEDIRVSKIDIQDKKDTIYISPILIKSDYILDTLAGKTVVSSNRVILKDLKEGSSIDIKNPYIKADFEEFIPDEPLYGKYSFGSDNISILTRDVNPLHFGFDMDIDIEKNPSKDLKYVDIKLSTLIEAKDEQTKKRVAEIEELNFNLQFKNLGLNGIKELISLEKKQNKIQMQLAKAIDKKDDIAMQKAVIEMEALQNSWVDIYNKLFIKNRTKLTLKKEIKAKKESKISIDLTFTGERLSGDRMGALISLGGNVDRLFKGDIDIEVEKELLDKLYPQFGFILEAMEKKGLAKLKSGVYTLKAKFEDGKIIINGTKYNPQELAMMILI